ncbi:MAG: ribulose-phosphate 3-epimerase [Alphaproteobacteria bacterium]|nr:ribulose-phosphate 3-epimerase [Alphaproteobacteria bacterium]
MAFRISGGRIAGQSIYSFESNDTTLAIKHVVEHLESELKERFDSAFITGNFGRTKYRMTTLRKNWAKEHKIKNEDISNMADIVTKSEEDMIPLHIVPLRYDADDFQNIATPVGQSAHSMSAIFGTIFASNAGLQNMREAALSANITVNEVFDVSFLLAHTVRPKKENSLIIDLGSDATTVSLWTVRGPVFYQRLDAGQSVLTDLLATHFNLSWDMANKIKCENISTEHSEMARFTPASNNHDFTKADVNNIIMPALEDIIKDARITSSSAIDKYNPTQIYITGGGANIVGIEDIILSRFNNIPVKNLGSQAASGALASYLWNYIRPLAIKGAKRFDFVNSTLKNMLKMFKKKPKQKFIPIMPSTLAFNMKDNATYLKFQSAGITMIHVDILDGLFVDDVYGGVDDLKYIRTKSNAHLNVHLMCESPDAWIKDTIDAGADTLTISIESRGAKQAWELLKKSKVRKGIAIRADTPLSELKPYLKDADEVLVMSIIPGAIGRPFIPESIRRIESLAAVRRKHKLKFKISVDGGIVPDTAKLCWRAGADFLVAGSYLKNAVDFPLAVNELLQK